jgi:glucose/arabinose dehydrogenase
MVVALCLIAGACSPPSETTLPTLAPASPPPSAAAVPTSPAPASTAPTGTAFDATGLAFTLEPYANVPGGPLAMVAPRDGTGRLFVATQGGQIWSVSDGAVAPNPMLDIAGRISAGGERGLLGLALHPNFPTDPRAFVDYTDKDGNTVVSSFTVDPADATRLDPGSEHVIFRQTQPFANHNGGAVVFGPDGFLYITLGDGGGGGDPQGNGQRLDTRLAKILRIDIDRSEGGRAYAIPAGNPFATDSSVRPEIWHYGLRNPWRISFDRANGDLWIGDVGQNKWEEVDVARAGTSGLNFGWNRMEGTHCFEPPSGCDQSGVTLPVAEYGHDAGCTVIGGGVYRGTAQPLMIGGYLFADYCSGNIWAIPATATKLSEGVEVGSTGSGVSTFGEDAAGELFLANLDGTISRIVAAKR